MVGESDFLGILKNGDEREKKKQFSECVSVVVIYCYIFLPLLLTTLSVNLAVLPTLSCVTVPHLSIIFF